MVLGGADGQDVAAVAEYEEGRLLAGHEFLDHHLGARRAEGAAEHVLDRGMGLGHGLGDDHALARGQPVGLDHDGCALCRHVGLGAVEVGEMRVGGGGRPAGIADGLGEGLGRLELRRRAGGPEDRDARIAQRIGHPGGQRRFGARDHQVDRVLAREFRDRAAILDVERCAGGDLGDPGIARGHDQLVAFGVLHHRPCQRMFAAPAAQDENVHDQAFRLSRAAPRSKVRPGKTQARRRNA